jgi:hypothetical protein
VTSEDMLIYRDDAAPPASGRVSENPNDPVSPWNKCGGLLLWRNMIKDDEQ